MEGKASTVTEESTGLVEMDVAESASPDDRDLVVSRTSRSAMIKSKIVPGSIEWYADKYPGFPPYVHEAFAMKMRGKEAYEEFLAEVQSPGIETSVGVVDPETETVVTQPKIVNWF